MANIRLIKEIRKRGEHEFYSFTLALSIQSAGWPGQYRADHKQSSGTKNEIISTN